MKASFLIIFFLVSLQGLFSQESFHPYSMMGAAPARGSSLQAACSNAITMHSGPSKTCPVTAYLFPDANPQIKKICEKVDSCGVRWAKVEVKGWVRTRCGNTRTLRRLMNRAHQWEVMPCGYGRSPASVSCSPNQCNPPYAKLQPCTIVTKISQGLPKCNAICVCFCGWVADQPAR